jgi:hypothetical protein
MSEENRIEKFQNPAGDTSLQINILTEGDKVHLTFSKPVMALIVGPRQAFGMAIALSEAAMKAQFPPPSPSQS